MIFSLSSSIQIELEGVSTAPSEFQFEHQTENEVSIIKLTFAHTPRPFSISWNIPQHDIQYRWNALAGKIGENYPQFLPPSWLNTITSELTRNVPAYALIGANGHSRVTAALSDAEHKIHFYAGVDESNFTISCSLKFNHLPELKKYQVELRLDLRDIPFEKALADTSLWWESFPNLTPCFIPPAAYEPVYSTWYSYHRTITAAAVESEVKASLDYGIKTVIIDDGWQRVNSLEGYSFAGDWEVDTTRFPDMAKHVARIKAMGVKYILWIALPFIGEKSAAYSLFKNKMLFYASGIKSWIIDPRFPEIRKMIIKKFCALATDLQLDGFKIDFLDRFALPKDAIDPAIKESFAGRDIKNIPEAVNKLLTDLTVQLHQSNCTLHGNFRAKQSDFLIEYRQDYIGPEMRRLANIFRASDCPGDRIANRRRIINLRLLSGNTAIHSDMLGWNLSESVESAARQIWNIIFSVPQISVQLKKLSTTHQKMLRFILAFWKKNRDLLLHNKISAPHPELNYPIVSTENNDEIITVIYQEFFHIDLNPFENKHIIIANASTSPDIYIHTNIKHTGLIIDCCGNKLKKIKIPPGENHITIPPCGILTL
ncbi:MAG: glycoside hydrolase family 36 protein [Lentisphaeria bacterium]